MKEAPKAIDPWQMVTNALDLMSAQLRLASIEMVIKVDKKCSFILGRIIQMEQVILDLLSKVRDTMLEKDDARKMPLCVSEGNDLVYLTAEDTGGGLLKSSCLVSLNLFT